MATSGIKVSTLRIVLLGQTGAGKSSTGNTILGRPDAFETNSNSPNSVTTKCQKQSGEVAGRKIDVIDTPGIGDELLSEQEVEGVKSELARCVEFSLPGPHAFLLVISLKAIITQEEKDSVRWIQDNFGDKAAGFTILLFTHGDKLEKETGDSIILENEDLRDLVNSCGGRYHVLDNEARGDTTQVLQLLKKIESMVQGNAGEHYTTNRIIYWKIILRGVAGLAVVGAATRGADKTTAIVAMIGAIGGAAGVVVAGAVKPGSHLTRAVAGVAGGAVAGAVTGGVLAGALRLSECLKPVAVVTTTVVVAVGSVAVAVGSVAVAVARVPRLRFREVAGGAVAGGAVAGGAVAGALAGVLGLQVVVSDLVLPRVVAGVVAGVSVLGLPEAVAEVAGRSLSEVAGGTVAGAIAVGVSELVSPGAVAEAEGSVAGAVGGVTGMNVAGAVGTIMFLNGETVASVARQFVPMVGGAIVGSVGAATVVLYVKRKLAERSTTSRDD